MNQAQQCNKHYNELIVMWCFTCSVLVCCECIELDHEFHSLKTTKNIEKFKRLQNSSSSIDTTSSITSNDSINNINESNLNFVSPPPISPQDQDYIQKPGQYHLPQQQSQVLLSKPTPKPLPSVPQRPAPPVPSQSNLMYPQMVNQTANTQSTPNLYPPQQSYENNNNNNINNNNMPPQQSYYIPNNIPTQQSFNNISPQQPYNNIPPQQHYQQPHPNPYQPQSQPPQQPFNSLPQFYIPPYQVPPQSQPISTIQNSTIPPPPPSLVLPIPSFTLIKKEKYDSRIQSDMDQEFQNSLYARDSIKLIKKLAEKGHSSSQAWLGSSYLYGNNGCKVNNDKASKWLKKASDQDHPKGSYDYFKYYEKTQDLTKAAILLEKSSNLGYEDGVGRYAHYLFQQQNYTKAFETFKLGAALGVENYNCITYLGVCFYDGSGVPIDYNEAYRFFYTASVQYNDNVSFFCLAQSLYYGHGVERNYQLAFEWLIKSSDSGVGYGSNGVGLCYLRGHGVEQDFSKAKQYFNKAKSQNPSLDLDSNLKAAEKCIQHKNKPKDYNKYINENLDQEKLKARYKKSKSNNNNNSNNNNSNNSSASDILDTISSTLDVASSVLSFFSDDN